MMGAGASSADGGTGLARQADGSADGPDPDEREAALVRHLMAMERIGERMVQLEGNVARLPAKRSPGGPNELEPEPEPEPEPDDLQVEIDGLETALAQLPELDTLDAPRKVLREQLTGAQAKKVKRNEGRAKAEHCAAVGRAALEQRDYAAAITAFEEGFTFETSADGYPGLMSPRLTSQLESGLAAARAGLAAQEKAREAATAQLAAGEAAVAEQDWEAAIKLLTAGLAEEGMADAELNALLHAALEAAGASLAARNAAAAEDAAVCIQAAQRGKQERLQLAEQHAAAVKIQAVQREKIARRQDAREVVMARYIMAMDQLGERMEQLEGKVAEIPSKISAITPEIEQTDADGREVLMAQQIMALDQLGERMEQLQGKVAGLPSKFGAATPEIERTDRSPDDPDGREVVLAQHIMALDRLGEQMVELEGRIAQLPAKDLIDMAAADGTIMHEEKTPIVRAEAAYVQRQRRAWRITMKKKRLLTLLPPVDKFAKADKEAEMMASVLDQAQLERQRAAMQRKKERESNPNWQKELKEKRVEEKRRMIEERNLQKIKRREDKERRLKREAEDKIMTEQLLNAFDGLDAVSLLEKCVQPHRSHCSSTACGSCISRFS